MGGRGGEYRIQRVFTEFNIQPLPCSLLNTYYSKLCSPAARISFRKLSKFPTSRATPNSFSPDKMRRTMRQVPPERFA